MPRHLSFIIFLTVFCALALAVVFFSPRNDTPLTREGFALNTFARITVYGGNERILDGAFDLIRDYEMIFSRTLPGSELYKLNAAPGGEWVSVSPGLYQTVETSLAYSRETDGLFDITTAPLSDLWNFTDGGRVPAQEEITAALEAVSYEKTELRAADNTSPANPQAFNITDTPACYIKTNGAIIDLGAAAKGYIADALAVYLRNSGINSAVIDLGGNIYALGKKNKDTDFNIGILVPFSGGELIGSVRVSDKAVVTSGVYQRYFTKGEKLYHHILDPRTGYPADTGLYSATVISPSALDADILSTACMLMGLDAALDRIESLPDTEAVFITDAGEVIQSSGVVLIN